MDVLFRPGRKLIGDRTAKSRLSVVRVTESKFADDVALYTTPHGNLESVARSFVGKAGEWGLTVSIEKTKRLATGDNLSEEDIAPVQVKGGEIEMVDHFTYLGSTLSRDGDVMEDVKCRIVKASRAFGCLRGSVFNNPFLSLATKKMVYRATVLSVLLYSAETWTLKAEHVNRLNTFHNRCVRTILGITRYKQWQQRQQRHPRPLLTVLAWTGPSQISSWTGGCSGWVIWEE